MRWESRASKSRRMPRKHLVRGETSFLSNFKTEQTGSASRAWGCSALLRLTAAIAGERLACAGRGNFFPIRIQNGTGGKRPCVRENLPESTNLRPHCRKYFGAGKPGDTVWSMAQAWKSLQVFRSSFTILQKYLVCEDTLDRLVERADKAGECLACRENVGGWFYLDYLILNTSRTRKNQFSPLAYFRERFARVGKNSADRNLSFAWRDILCVVGKPTLVRSKKSLLRGVPYVRGKTAARPLFPRVQGEIVLL